MTTIALYWFITTLITFGGVDDETETHPILLFILCAAFSWFAVPYKIGKILINL